MNMRSAGIAGGLAGIGAGLGGLFGGGNMQDPYAGAAKYFNKIPGTIKPYYDPYINAGRGALGQLQGQYGNLINDPTQMMNQIGRGYQKSPGFDFQMQQGMNAANNAAGAGGMLGSQAHQFNAANMAQGLANQDYWNYVTRGLGQYGAGLEGMGDINKMGYGASNELAQSLGNTLLTQGQNKMNSAMFQNQLESQKGQGWGDLLGGLGSLAAWGGFL